MVSITSDSVNACDWLIEVTRNFPAKTVAAKTSSKKSIPKNFNEKKGNI